MDGVRRRTRARGLALVAAVLLVVAMPGVADGLVGAQPAEDPPAATEAPPRSEELDRSNHGLAGELQRAEEDVVAAQQRLLEVEAELQLAQREREDAVVAEDQALAALSRYSVAAYVNGGPPRPPLDPTADVVATTEQVSDRVMVSTITGDLIERRRRSTASADEADAAAADALLRHADASAALEAAIRRRDELERRLATGRMDADEARRAEEEERERLAAEEAQAKVARLAGAFEPPPFPPDVHRSGVVPGSIAPAELAVLMGVEIPRTALEAYFRAARRVGGESPGCGIDWALLGGIGLVETSHGTYLGSYPNPDGSVTPPIVGIALDGRFGTVEIRDTDGGTFDGDPVWDRAVGPMQFIPTTWRAFGTDGNGDGYADPHNIYDAAVAAGRYLCHAGRGDLRNREVAERAVRAYNNSTEYVIKVLSVADGYRARAVVPELGTTTTSTARGATTTTAPASTTTTTTGSSTTTASTTTSTALTPP